MKAPFFSPGDDHALAGFSSGCYYGSNLYTHGEQIQSQEACLNCTCTSDGLHCYLRTCPYYKPIGHNCTVTKEADQCCPTVVCPQGKADIEW
uniref:VWFC domain-containing protein n=1 Tax=Strigamia maritima TaxID=126957 RepID=T1INP8_STRMM